MDPQRSLWRTWYMIYHVRTIHALNRKISGSAHAHSVVQRFVRFMMFLVIWEANFCQCIPRFDKSMIIESSMGFWRILCSLCPMQCYRKAKLCTRGRAGVRMGRTELGLVGCEEVIKFMEGSEESSETSERTSPQAAKAAKLSSTATATNPSTGVSEMSTDDMSVHKHRQQCNLQWSCEVLKHVLQGLLMPTAATFVWGIFSLPSWGARDVCGAEVIVACNSNKREAKETVKTTLDATPAPQPEWISLSEVFPEMSFFRNRTLWKSLPNTPHPLALCKCVLVPHKPGNFGGGRIGCQRNQHLQIPWSMQQISIDSIMSRTTSTITLQFVLSIVLFALDWQQLRHA